MFFWLFKPSGEKRVQLLLKEYRRQLVEDEIALAFSQAAVDHRKEIIKHLEEMSGSDRGGVQP